MDLNLLQKTELWIEGISLQNAHLDAIAAQVAAVLELEPREVMVVDVREDHLVLDILRPVLKASQISGKGEEILRRISAIPGVYLSAKASLHAEGALGWVYLDRDDYQATWPKARQIGKGIQERVAKRAIIFSTGVEVEKGLIADTNFPLIEECLKREGYTVSFGGVLSDNIGAIAYQLEKALDEGFGLILTTGGVGAEEKDCTVESVLRVDPSAATPYILKFEAGTGRHVKDGVRIAVGKVGISRLVALPGPTREVGLGLDRLLEGLDREWDEKQIADHIASGLRKKWHEYGSGSGHP
ncbi:MAG: competence/damage-inducible protein A [Proteobacteria bacterium]|nr:competence/damage-inducible protein A [Pseudomonadota bacterium]